VLLEDKFLEVWDSNKITNLHDCLRRCVEEQNLEGFDEAIIKFVSAIQIETLKLDKKIVIPNLI
jgi:hypothetical protein